MLRKNDAKRLAAIYKLAFEIIPQDPTLADYRQGTTLGDHHKHWFHAKFYQQLTTTSQPGRSKWLESGILNLKSGILVLGLVS